MWRRDKKGYFNTRLAQSVERQPFKLVAVGSSPTSGNASIAQLVRASVL